MSSAKVPCKVCGVEIQTSTAARTRGLCMPCDDGSRTEPEDFQVVRRRWRREIVAADGKGEGGFAKSYEAGDREAVWDELHRLDLRRPTSEEVFEDIVDCVRLTMRRVRSNVEDLVEGLTGLGYAFCCPEDAHIPPTQDDLSTLAALEDRYGPLPLTLRLYYEEVGSVDFRQSEEQSVPEYDHRRASAPPLQTLGEYDPLYVTPVARLARKAEYKLTTLARPFGEPPGNVRLACWLAPDEFHKSIYSGGGDYHVYLPEPAVDFPLVGSYVEDTDSILDDDDQYPALGDCGQSEFFLSHLRRCFLNGGFRGRTDPAGEGRQRPPHWGPLRELAAKLLPV